MADQKSSGGEKVAGKPSVGQTGAAMKYKNSRNFTVWPGCFRFAEWTSGIKGHVSRPTDGNLTISGPMWLGTSETPEIFRFRFSRFWAASGRLSTNIITFKRPQTVNKYINLTKTINKYINHTSDWTWFPSDFLIPSDPEITFWLKNKISYEIWLKSKTCFMINTEISWTRLFWRMLKTIK